MNVDLALDIISWTFLMIGGFFSIVGGIGLLRLPDLFTRLHGGGITDTLGAGTILVGLMFQSGISLVTVKLVMILFFLWITSPTSCHALARAALYSGMVPQLPGADKEGVSSKQ